MQQIQQQEPGQAVVGDGGHQVVHGGDQGAGGHSRIDVQLFEEHGNAGSGDAGQCHGDQQGDADAGGNRESVSLKIRLEQVHIKADDHKRGKAQNDSV